MKDIFKYLFYLGLLLAVVGAFVPIPFLGLILALLGIVLGIFYFDSGDVVNFGVRYLLFAAVYGAFGEIPAVGMYLTNIFGGVLAFYTPIALTMLVMYFVKKYFMGGSQPASKRK